MRRLMIVAAVTGVLAGCAAEVNEDTAAYYDEPAIVSERQDANARAGDAAPSADALAAAGTLLAYSYGATLELPAANVDATMTAHEAECRAAGPRVCQVLSSNLTEMTEENVRASLSLRAEPGWLSDFRDGLASDAEDAEGRITQTTVSAQDLTRSIVDTEARLNTKMVLRERLTALLADQPNAEVDDLLAVERELARVQGEIDSAQSQLEVMRRRVEMSILDLTYNSERPPFSRDAFAGLKRALGDFFYELFDATGSVIYVIANVLPFAIVLFPALWLLRRWWRGWRARRAAAKT